MEDGEEEAPMCQVCGSENITWLDKCQCSDYPGAPCMRQGVHVHQAKPHGPASEGKISRWRVLDGGFKKASILFLEERTSRA